MSPNTTYGCARTKVATGRLISSFVETLPIASPSPVIRAEVEPAVARLIVLIRTRQEATRAMLDGLRTEFVVF